jgi:4-hydroxythreonine-4-phosphate dehydrogenase
LAVLQHDFPAPASVGQTVTANASAIVSGIERCVDLVQSGAASALCTNPINKKVLQDGAGFPFPGHTEFLAHLCGVERSVMMLFAPELRVVPVTIHIALKDVKQALTEDLLTQTIEVSHAALQRDFGIAKPRIAVAGLNPHAGEGGAMGHEEINLINPVIQKFRDTGMNISDAQSADTMFHAAARDSYDLALCMYHDQALIPLKTLNFSGGVNATLGLPFVRTSPDHGTAYNVAGQGIADPTSLIAALRAAHSMTIERARHAADVT